MSWGNFAGGFSQGFMGGLQSGRALRQISKENKIEDLRGQGMQEAKDAVANQMVQGGPQQQAANGGVTGEQAKAPEAGPPRPYVVNGKEYGNRDEAFSAAQAQVTPEQQWSYFVENKVPAIKAKMVEYGDMEAASKLDDWANQEANKKYAATYYKTKEALATGDYQTAMDGFATMHKQLNDGLTVVGKPEPVKDNAGNVTAYTMKVKNDKTGQEFDQTLTPNTMRDQGMAYFNPLEKYKWDLQSDMAAQKAGAELAVKRAEMKDQFGYKVQEKQLDQNNALEKLTIQKQLEDANASGKVKREVNAKVQALRDAGYTDDFINQALPAILGVGDYKKATSPEEARRLAFSDRMKSDPTFTRKPAADQQAIIDQDMKLIYGGISPSKLPAGGGLPGAGGTAQPAKNGVPIYDAKTGQIIYR